MNQGETECLAPGSVVGGYRVTRVLGAGGMSRVYEVTHEKLGTRFALKVFARTGKGDVAFLRERFVAEGRLLARLESPRLVRVHDFLESPTGEPCYVMDLVLGPDGKPATLEDRRQARTVEERDVFRWYADMAEALRVVHAAGVVHRDVKLTNILVAADGHAVLADFGISRYCDAALRKELAVETTFAADATTNSQPVLGTGNYLPPELRAGKPAVPASDYYALGVALFRLLTSVWYEPGTNVLDLLAPFDPAWRRIFPSLLAVAPEDRCLPPPPAPRKPRRRLFTAAALVFFALSAGTVFGLFRPKVPETTVGTHNMVRLWEGGPYWAKTNVGAEEPWNPGYYFWWGDVVGYRRENDAWVASDGSCSGFMFSSNNVSTCGKDVAALKNEGWITADGVLAPEHDAAHAHWGGGWRMPTLQEVSDLNDKCDWTWTATNGVSGYVVRGRGRYGNNSIFLPAVGLGVNARIDGFSEADPCGYYWLSTPDSGNFAGGVQFSFRRHRTAGRNRERGQSVRPVLEHLPFSFHLYLH